MSRDEERQLKRERDAEAAAYINERAAKLAENNQNRKNAGSTTIAAQNALFLDQLNNALKMAFAKKLPTPIRVQKTNGKTKRVLNLILSDTHYQSLLDPREVGHSYGSVEEARRTAAVCQEVAEYKTQYRNETELNVYLLGDLIQGQLHDPRDGAPIAEQVAAAIRILTQAMNYLASSFKKVTIYTATGNHERITSRHPNRAVNGKWDSFATIIYVALKEALRAQKNVEVKISYAPTGTYELFGMPGYLTHGDSHLRVGYPSQSINVKSLKIQACELNNSRIMKGEKPYKLMMVGHVHVGSMTHVPGNIVLITNPCLIPPDAFAKSININDTTCGAWLWETVEHHMVGDSRLIVVGTEQDKMSYLDKIIQPFNGIDN